MICKIGSSTRSSNVIPCIFYSPLSFSLSSLRVFLLYSTTHFYHSLPPLLPLPRPRRRFFVHSLRRPFPSLQTITRRTHKFVRYLGIILNIVDRTMAFQSRETRLTFTCNYLSRHAVPRNAITPQANRMPLSSGRKKRLCVESKYRSILGTNRNPCFLEVSFLLFFFSLQRSPLRLTFSTRVSFHLIRIYPDSRSFASINSV